MCANWSRDGLDRPEVTATLLSVLYPGLGHLYLHSWLRAGAWLALALASVAALFPAGTVVGDPAALGSVSWVAVLLAVSVPRVLGAADAWLLARGEAAAGTVRCSECTRPIDDDLEFCHWCLEPQDAGGG